MINKIAAKLPFRLQENNNIKRQLISGFEVLSIDEWNNNDIYGEFSISLVDEVLYCVSKIKI